MSRVAKKMHLLLKEQRFDYTDRDKLYGVCVWCGYPGGEGWQPRALKLLGNKNWGALDMHEWLFKRSRRLPDEITFALENMVLLHHKCHLRHGQSKEMVKRCYHHKKKFYDLQKWVDTVTKRQPSINPINLDEVYGDGNMSNYLNEAKKPLFITVQTVFDEKKLHLIPEEDREDLSKFATNPMLAKIVAIGFGKLTEEAFEMGVLTDRDYTQAQMLDGFWKRASNYSPVISYAFNYFDYPVIKAATAKIPMSERKGVGLCTQILSTSNFRNGDSLDLQYKLGLNYGEFKSLDFAHEAIVGKKIDTSITGADIHRLYYKESNYEAIKEYSISRLDACKNIYLMGADIYWNDYLDIAKKQENFEKMVYNNLPSNYKGDEDG